MMAITFRARKPNTATNTEGMVAIEVVKNNHPLGVWLISIEDAQRLSSELSNASGIRIPENTPNNGCACEPMKGFICKQHSETTDL